MNDSRGMAVLAGAAVLVAALFAPWYALDLSGPARDAFAGQTGQLPPALGEFARGLLSVLPERIVVNAWVAFERTDIVLLACALGAGFSALLARLDVAALAGAAAAGTTVLAMVDKPGSGGFVRLQWGPWLALAAGVTIVAAARMRRREDVAQPADWPAQVVPSAAMAAERSRSVAPPR